MNDATPSPDNVVSMTDKIMEQGNVGREELAKRRRIALRAFEITSKQLEADAEKMEHSAILGECDMKQRHEHMRTAECLRVAQAWLVNLCQPEPKPENQ